jgi:hypothetical protein
MVKRRKIFFSLLFVMSFSLSYAVPSDTTSIIDNIYNFNFQKAKELLSFSSEKNIILNETLNLEMCWWMALESENKDRFSEFLNRLDHFEKGSNNNLTEIISATYRMRYYACTNKKYRLPFLLMKINYNLKNVNITELENSDPEENELFILYRSFLDLIQDNYSFEKLLSGSGKKQVLIDRIESVIRSGSSTNKTIGRYFLMKYYLDIEKDKSKAFSFITVLHEQYPKNKIFAQLLTN